MMNLFTATLEARDPAYYIEAMGGRLEIIARFPQRTVGIMAFP
jgi:hypothetical protein